MKFASWAARSVITILGVLAATMLAAGAAPSDVSSSGTGFFVNAQGWIVTNAHVVEGCTSISVPRLGTGTDLAIDKQNDLAAFKLYDGAGKPHLPLRRSQPRLGEDIAAYGFPLNGLLSDSIKVTTGNINSLVGMDNDTRYLQVSTPLQPGNSGGPVVDQWGSIVGVSTAVLGSKFTDATGIAAQNVNFAIRSNVVELFLQSRNIQFDTADPAHDDKPLSTADLSDKAVPAVVQVLCHGAPATVADTETPTKPTMSSTMPRPSFRSFTPANSYDVMGFDYATLKNVSEVECENACQGDLSCKATTYNRKAHFCFLKSDAKILVRNVDAVASVQSNLTGSLIFSTFVIRSGRDMAGGDYSRIRNTNFIACYAACEVDYQCRAFAYVRKKNECWLKNQIGYVSTKSGVDLGLK
ncbi:hypothetical protein BFN67_13770 [Pseudaminobacter manganicus]|uniref:Apple domain-containing protein n=2 Tax=Manganibacter manganicus TaxID=1873176 RepID=A0A1V8RTC8_9HYPH|nr:hypothetical protein BFN67_13770 [Pseudaminobacter manganicus]